MIYCLRGFLQQKEKQLVLNSLVISHFHFYSSYWYIAEASDIGKALKSGGKSLLSSKKLESAHDTKLCLSGIF